MKILIRFVLFCSIQAIAGFAASPKNRSAPCAAPKVCASVQEKFNELKRNPTNHVKFKRFVALLKKLSVKNCAIPGVVIKVPAYRVCYDGGFSTKTVNYQEVTDQNFSGPLKEDLVFEWFDFVDNSKFPEGKKFTRGSAFGSTLDGYWAERFSSN